MNEATYTRGHASLMLPTLPYNPADCVFGLQTHPDGRAWVCINGETFLRFKPNGKLVENFTIAHRWPPPSPCTTCGGRKMLGGPTGFNYDQPVPCPDCAAKMPVDFRGVVIDPTKCQVLSPPVKGRLRSACLLPLHHDGDHRWPMAALTPRES